MKYVDMSLDELLKKRAKLKKALEIARSNFEFENYRELLNEIMLVNNAIKLKNSNTIKV